MMRKCLKMVAAVIAVAVGLCCYAPVQAVAGSLVYDLDTTFNSGDQSPNTGASSWLRAAFNDIAANVVQLTISATGLVSGEKVGVMAFNLDPVLSPSILGFSLVSASGMSATPSTGLNFYQADGDGKYDIKFDFPESGANTFTQGDSITYQITGTGISAASFNAASLPAGGKGPFKVAAHIQGIPLDKGRTASTWVGTNTVVPEPVSSSLFLLGAGAIGARMVRRRKR